MRLVLIAVLMSALALAWVSLNPPAGARVDTSKASGSEEAVKAVEHRLKRYWDIQGALDRNIQYQAALIIVVILLALRRSDEGTLKILGTAVPLSYLHFLSPLGLLYLWLQFGYLFNRLIDIRIRSLEIVGTKHWLSDLFRDTGLIDGWFMNFVANSNVDQRPAATLFLTIFLVLLHSVSHAAMLGMTEIGFRRFVEGEDRWRSVSTLVFTFYALILAASYLSFSIDGSNRNWIQLLVPLPTILLLWGLLKLQERRDGASASEAAG